MCYFHRSFSMWFVPYWHLSFKSICSLCFIEFCQFFYPDGWKFFFFFGLLSLSVPRWLILATLFIIAVPNYYMLTRAEESSINYICRDLLKVGLVFNILKCNGFYIPIFSLFYFYMIWERHIRTFRAINKLFFRMLKHIFCL